MGKMPNGARRDPKSGALIFSKKTRGQNIDLRIIRKILLELYRVLPKESKEEMKLTIKRMLESL